MKARPASSLLVFVAVLGLAAAGCSDDGAHARSGGGSASGPGSAAGGTAAADVPKGVAAQYATVAQEIAAEGGAKESGEWRVAYIVEPAEPWFEPDGEGYRFREPAGGETHHIEIIPFERETGRILPGVPIRLEVVGGDGRVIDAKDLNFYYSEFFHYANNFVVPQAGAYTLRATLQAPRFFRHGEQAAGPALAQGATVEFTGVELRPES
ncbi:MAG: hypothetical protein ACRDT0_21630 [Pseudonocardiaceae bacterium]